MENESALSGKRKRVLLAFTAFLFIAALAFAAYWALWGRYHVTTDNAYVAGNLVQVSAQVPGTVVAILADEPDAGPFSAFPREHRSWRVSRRQLGLRA